MKNITRMLALALMATAAISCKKPAPEAPTVDAAQLKIDIQSMESAYAEGVTDGNIEEVAYYADDAVSYDQNKPPLQGRMAIIKNIKEQMATAPKGTTVRYITNEVFPSETGDQVVELGSFKIADSTNTAMASGNYVAVFQKKGDKYVCIRDMATSDQPKKP